MNSNLPPIDPILVKTGSLAADQTSSEVVEKKNRSSRSRLNTRRKLLDAAQRMMAKKGVEQTTILDITEEADVGFGSFYNHFSTKEDIVTAIATEHAEKFVEIANLIISKEEDITQALAFNIKFLLTKTITDPIWGWFIVRTQGLVPKIDELFRNNIILDLEKAIEAQGYKIVPATAAAMTVGALIEIMRSILDGSLDSSVIEQTAEYLLRMYGIPFDKAHNLSKTPLPNYISE